MKKTFKYLAAAFAVTAAVSCAKQEELAPEESNTPTGTYQYTLNVSQESTKVSMDGLSILWSADDQIAIGCSYDSDYKNAIASGGAQSIENPDSYTPSTSATFTLNLTADYTPLTAAYPYFDAMTTTSGISINNGQACTAIIPSSQTGIKDNIPAGAFAMVGRIITSTNTCQMSNVGAVIKFEITNDNIASLRFEGNNSEIISGTRYYFTKAGESPESQIGTVAKETEANGKTYVTLLPEGDVFEAGTYYFVVSPNDLTEGFTMTLTNSDGIQAVRKTNTRFNIERNHKYTNFGSDEGWFSDIITCTAGQLGSADGTSAVLYGKAPATVEGMTYGFQTSADGKIWTDFDGIIENRFFTDPDPDVNIYTGNLTGITPETAMYYRAVCTNATGVTTYGKAVSFKTFANAQSVVIDLYNGWDTTHWPFTNISMNSTTVSGTNIGINKGTGNDALWKTTDCALQVSDNLAFTAYITHGMWLTRANGALTMKVYLGDHIKFPVIEGKKPIAVVLMNGGLANADPTSSNNSVGQPSIRKVGATEDAVGGNKWNPRSSHAYYSNTWYLQDTDTDQYELYFNSTWEKGLNCYMSYLEVIYADADSKSAKIEQNIVFVNGYGDHTTNPEVTKADWPFTTKLSSWSEGNAFPDTEYSTATYPFVKYSFHMDTWKSGIWAHTRAGLKFGGMTGHNYMKFHAVEGYRLSYIKIRSGSSATSYSITTDSSGETATPGGETTKISNAYDTTVEFKLGSTNANTDYYLYLQTTTAAQIRELWITYELVK